MAHTVIWKLNIRTTTTIYTGYIYSIHVTLSLPTAVSAVTVVCEPCIGRKVCKNRLRTCLHLHLTLLALRPYIENGLAVDIRICITS